MVEKFTVAVKRFNLVLCLVLFPMIGDQALFAQDTHDGPPLADAEAEEMNEDYSSPPSAKAQVLAAIEDYYRKRNVIQGITGPKGQIYYHWIEPVTADPASTAWVKSRALAFDRAMLRLQSDFVFDQWGEAFTEVESNIDENRSSDNRNFAEEDITKDRAEANWDKLVALEGAILDVKLRELGIDPTEFGAVPPAQRKDLFVDRFIETTLDRAMGRSAGLIVMKTYEGKDDRNNHAIGVVAKYSPALQQLAYNVANGTAPFLATKAGKYKPVGEFVMDQTPEQLSTTFGVRIMFDEQGRVVVLSHGMWGLGYKGNNERQRSRAEQGAARQAVSSANSGLAKFVNGRLKYLQETERGEVQEHFLTKRGDETPNEEDIVTYVERLNSEVSLNARSDMRGVRTVRQWTYDHPYGHTITGAIRAWRIDFVEQANSVRNFTPEQTRTQVRDEDTEPEIIVNPGVSSSDAYDDMDEDF